MRGKCKVARARPCAKYKLAHARVEGPHGVTQVEPRVEERLDSEETVHAKVVRRVEGVTTVWRLSRLGLQGLLLRESGGGAESHSLPVL